MKNEQLEETAKAEEKNAINQAAAEARQVVGCVVGRAALIAAINSLEGEDILINTQDSEVEGLGKCGMIELTDGKTAVHFFNKEFIDWMEQQVPQKVQTEPHLMNEARSIQYREE